LKKEDKKNSVTIKTKDKKGGKTMAKLSELEELGDEIIGRRVKIIGCEANIHGNNPGCVCVLKGMTVTIEKKYKAACAGTPSYHIKGSDKTVRRSEVKLPRQKK
jgi:hypothetical protein